MSAANASTAGLPDSRTILVAAAWVRGLSRPVMPRAPSAARPAAAARPMPPVPPVTSAVVPAIGPGKFSVIGGGPFV